MSAPDNTTPPEHDDSCPNGWGSSDPTLCNCKPPSPDNATPPAPSLADVVSERLKLIWDLDKGDTLEVRLVVEAALRAAESNEAKRNAANDSHIPQDEPVTVRERKAMQAAATECGYNISAPPAFVYAWMTARRYVHDREMCPHGLGIGLGVCDPCEAEARLKADGK